MVAGQSKMGLVTFVQVVARHAVDNVEAWALTLVVCFGKETKDI